MKNKLIKIISVALSCALMLTALPIVTASAASKTEVVYFEISDDAATNGRTLCELLKGNKARKIIFPEKGKIHIDRVLYVGNNKTIVANNCTVIQDGDKKPIMLCNIKKTNYKNIKNVTIDGGTWKTKSHNENITFRFEHGSNIKFRNCTIYTHYNAHAIELIACKKVKINGCTVEAVNKHKSSTSLEEAIQIDVATAKTAPTLAKAGSKYVNGAACKNITIKNCTVKGSRGICANRCSDYDKKTIKMHKNIKIMNNTITGTTSEALVLHNTVGYTVSGNKIKTKNKRYSETYSNGLNIALFGKSSSTTKYKNTIENNKIYGGLYSLYVKTFSSSKFGTTTIKGNSFYCRKGTNNCYTLSGATKFAVTKNKKNKW